MVKGVYNCHKALYIEQNSSELHEIKTLLNREFYKTTIKITFEFFPIWGYLVIMKPVMNSQVNIFVTICFYLSWINMEWNCWVISLSVHLTL